MLHKCSLRRLGYVLCVDCVFMIIYFFFFCPETAIFFADTRDKMFELARVETGHRTGFWMGAILNRRSNKSNAKHAVRSCPNYYGN